jgi:hypothetical protein
VTRNCLIVSPHFPPSTLAGVHRTRHLAKHLPAHGWRAKVICVDPSFHIERLDPALAALVPADASIVRVGALPVNFTRHFGIAGDIGLRSFYHIRATIEQEMRTGRPDVVMITGSPYFPMLLAGWIKRRWGVPVVLDFQDPWVTLVGATASVGTKAWFAHRLAVFFEPKAVRNAAFITSVSDRQNEELAIRHSFLDPARMEGVPIGGDPEDFETVRNTTCSTFDVNPSVIQFAYVGTALPRSTPLFQALLKGLAFARHLKPELASKLAVRCVGTSNQPDDARTFRIKPLACAEGVNDAVHEEPARVPFLDALRILAKTHVVLMIGSDEPHYTASKIYPGMMCGRPFLSLFHRASSAHQILSCAGGGIAFGFETKEELEVLPLKIAEAIITLATNPDSVGHVDPAAYAEYTAYAVAGKFAAIFDRLRAERMGFRQEQNIS